MRLIISRFIKAEDTKKYIIGKKWRDRIKGYNLMATIREDYFKLPFLKRCWIGYMLDDEYFIDVLTKKEYKEGEMIDLELIPFSIQTSYALIKNESDTSQVVPLPPIEIKKEEKL